MAKRKHGRKTSSKAKPASRGKKPAARRRAKVLAGSQAGRLGEPERAEPEEEDVAEVGSPKARRNREEGPGDWEE